MNKNGFAIIGTTILLLQSAVVSLRLGMFTQSDLIKLKTFVGTGLLPQIKQTLLSTNTTKSLERHIKTFIKPDIVKEVLSNNLTTNTPPKVIEEKKSLPSKLSNNETNRILSTNSTSFVNSTQIIQVPIPVPLSE